MDNSNEFNWKSLLDEELLQETSIEQISKLLDNFISQLKNNQLSDPEIFLFVESVQKLDHKFRLQPDWLDVQSNLKFSIIESIFQASNSFSLEYFLILAGHLFGSKFLMSDLFLRQFFEFCEPIFQTETKSKLSIPILKIFHFLCQLCNWRELSIILYTPLQSLIRDVSIIRSEMRLIRSFKVPNRIQVPFSFEDLTLLVELNRGEQNGIKSISGIINFILKNPTNNTILSMGCKCLARITEINPQFVDRRKVVALFSKKLKSESVDVSIGIAALIWHILFLPSSPIPDSTNLLSSTLTLDPQQSQLESQSTFLDDPFQNRFQVFLYEQETLEPDQFLLLLDQHESQSELSSAKLPVMLSELYLTNPTLVKRRTLAIVSIAQSLQHCHIPPSTSRYQSLVIHLFRSILLRKEVQRIVFQLAQQQGTSHSNQNSRTEERNHSSDDSDEQKEIPSKLQKTGPKNKKRKTRKKKNVSIPIEEEICALVDEHTKYDLKVLMALLFSDSIKFHFRNEQHCFQLMSYLTLQICDASVHFLISSQQSRTEINVKFLSIFIEIWLSFCLRTLKGIEKSLDPVTLRFEINFESISSLYDLPGRIFDYWKFDLSRKAPDLAEQIRVSEFQLSSIWFQQIMEKSLGRNEI